VSNHCSYRILSMREFMETRAEVIDSGEIEGAKQEREEVK
jgi:hypothetical protein